MKKERIKSAFLSLFIAVVVNAALAAIFSLIASRERTFAAAFQFFFPVCFWLFGGYSIIVAFLLIATNFPEDKAPNYGMGFYYGTYLCTVALTQYLDMDDTVLALAISGIISGLACYIFWLKNNPKE